MKNFTYSIVIPTYNHFELTRNCWYSVRDNTDLNISEIIFVDNGSTDETKEWVLAQQRMYKNIVFLSYPEAIGGGNAYSIGFDISRSDYLVALNNDTVILGPNWLDIMREPFLKQDKVAITGPVKLHSLETNAEFIVLFCAMISRKVWKLVGGLMDMGPGYGEDIDWCYSEDTQIVTDNGIKYIKDIVLEDKLLTLNKHGIMEYHHPTKLFKKHESELLHFKSRRLDLLVSADQDLYVGYDMPEKNIHKPLDFIKASDINNKLWKKQCRYYVKKNGGFWNGIIDLNVFKDLCIDEDKLYLFVKFIAWFLSEGNLGAGKLKRGCYEICIHQSMKNLDNRIDIENTLYGLGFKFNSSKDKFVCYDRTGKLFNYLKQFGHAKDKFIPSFVKNMTIKYIDLFLDTYAKGDGSIYEDTGKKVYYTSSIKMRDDIIELLLKSGRTFSFSEWKKGLHTFSSGKIYWCKGGWNIQVCTRKEQKTYLPKGKEIEYNDYVYDVNVPNNTIYVIRNGKGCWSSNCRRAIDKGFKIVQVLECESNGSQMVGAFPIYHAGEGTVHDNPDWNKITASNREKLRMKWGTSEIKIKSGELKL